MASSDAERKFWQRPELVEMLLEKLDAGSTLNLAKAHTLTSLILQGASGTLEPWKRLISFVSQDLEDDGSFQQQRGMVQQMAGSVVAKMENSKPLLMELLHLICAKHAYRQHAVGGRVEVSCSCPVSQHSVSSMGFVLLEDCEGILSSAEQSLERFNARALNPWDMDLDFLISALSSRASRQRGTVKLLDFGALKCNIQDKSHIDLLQNCAEVRGFPWWVVGGEIGATGWEVLARVFRLHSSEVFAARISFELELFLEATSSQMRNIWEALVEEALQFGHGVDQPFGTLCVHKKNGEGGRIETVKWFYKWTGSEETWDELVAYKEKTKAEMQGGK